MFDESNSFDLTTDPQSLSAAPSDVLQAVVDHQGTVFLTRRLATLLAERDAHITALTRLAEEYKIPKGRIDQAASRARQGEERRLALSTAADEDLAPSVPSDSGVCSISKTKAHAVPLLTNTLTHRTPATC